MEIIKMEMYEINVKKMTKIVSESYIKLIENNIPFKTFPSVMLWGAPGVGKSQGVREIANKIRDKTNKKVVITDVRLLLFNPVDLRGIPTSNEDKTLAVWLKPKIFQMDEDESVVNILFLDEISAAPPSVQAAAYQITLDRMVGEHKLPDNCIVIAAGNRMTDKSVAYNMPKALANRLCHFEIKVDVDSWHDWAIGASVHEYVVGFIEYNSGSLMKFDPSGTNLAFPTPRSWEMVSNILNNVSDNPDEVFPLIVGCIGYSTAINFKAWIEIYNTIPSVSDVFDGTCYEIPLAQEQRIALQSSMVSFARKHPDKKLVDNSVEYACRLPLSFRKKLLHDYYYTPEVRSVIAENEVFKTALREHRYD